MSKKNTIDRLHFIAFTIERLVKFAEAFDKAYSKCVPGFSMPWEAHIHRATIAILECEAESLAAELGDREKLVLRFVRNFGYVTLPDGSQLNTARRLVKHLADKQA